MVEKIEKADKQKRFEVSMGITENREVVDVIVDKETGEQETLIQAICSLKNKINETL